MKLRLLLLERCDRDCAGCCNKDWDLASLPTVDDYTIYDEFLLTGGEPLLEPTTVQSMVAYIRSVNKAPIYLYTAKSDDIKVFSEILDIVDGITLTLHDGKDLENFVKLQDAAVKANYDFSKKSMRLNVFRPISVAGMNTTGWTVKDDIVWIQNCPLPADEEFRRAYCV